MNKIEQNNSVNYTLGFIFNKKLDKVLLIKKDRPHFMSGRLNGVGGKIIKLEPPRLAMTRECKEETSLEIKPGDWISIGLIRFGNDNIYIYTISTDLIFKFKQMESEILSIYSSEYIQHSDNKYFFKNFKRMENIDWIIPVCLQKIKNNNLIKFEAIYNN